MKVAAAENDPALAKAEAETRALLALLTAERPDADEIKARWYELGLAVRAAVAELRAVENARRAAGR